MAKLEIKLNEQGKERRANGESSFTLRDYDVLVDGQEPTYLTALNLSMSADSYNEATISFAVDDLDIDADALTTLNAEHHSKQGTFLQVDGKEIAKTVKEQQDENDTQMKTFNY